MKYLYLLRHAKSDWSRALPDHDRPLAGRGRRAAPAMAEYMAKEALVPEIVLCSTAERARQTWDGLERRLGADAAVVFERSLYGASPGEILDVVATVPAEVQRALVVGHNPGMEELAVWLSERGPERQLRRMKKKFPTAALAVLRIEGESWTGVAPDRCELERFIRPKELPEAEELEL